jgi:hypothetical protein
MVVLAAFALVGLAAATFLPTNREQRGARGTLAAPDALDAARHG